MASSFETTKISVHSRSISLPSNSHSLNASVEEHLCRLRISEESSSSSLSMQCNKLDDLKDLYESANELLQSPQQSHLSCGEDVLCGSLRLLDLCSTTKDAFLQMRDSVQDLESSLRRREADVPSKARNYLTCKKNANKMVSKCLASFNNLKTNKSIETPAIVSILREVEEVSITIFESLFSSVFPAKETLKQNRWSLVFKSTQSKRVSCKEDREENINQVKKIDMALEALYKKTSKSNDILRIQEVQKHLVAFDMNIQEYEEKLDCLIRSLIKTRVSLLNVLNH